MTILRQPISLEDTVSRETTRPVITPPLTKIAQTMKLALLLLVLGVTFGFTVAQDYLEHLLETHDLVEDESRSKLNMGSDKIYIQNKGNEHEYSMTYQTYLPNKGGPGDQSFRFPIKMHAPGEHPGSDEDDDDDERKKRSFIQ